MFHDNHSLIITQLGDVGDTGIISFHSSTANPTWHRAPRTAHPTPASSDGRDASHASTIQDTYHRLFTFDCHNICQLLYADIEAPNQRCAYDISLDNKTDNAFSCTRGFFINSHEPHYHSLSEYASGATLLAAVSFEPCVI